MSDNTEEVPADDIRSQLMAAMADQTETTESTQTTETTTEQVETTGEATASERNRDEKGRFSKYDQDAAAQAQQAVQNADPNAQANAQPTVDPAAPQAVRPPPGWSPASKAIFDSLPEHIRADVAKREQEISQGFAKLQRYKDVEHYADHFEANGFTLGQAFDRYAEADRKLNNDFTGGIVELCTHFGVHPVALARKLAAAFEGALDQNSQAQPGASSQPDLQAVLQQHLKPLQETINSLKGERDAERRQTVSKSVDAFFDDPANRYADNVAHLMVPMLNAGMKLEEAYEQACWQHPEVRQQLINEQLQKTTQVQSQTAAKAKQAAKSLTGAPGAGSAPTAGSSGTLQDDIRSVMRSGRV